MMMKTFFVTLSLCLLASAQTQTYQLVWSDEFNGNSLDLSKWQYEVNCDGGGNNELQCYTNSASNLQVSNGNLVITARPQAVNGKQYSSARINTRAAAAWKYGKIEFRAKMPQGQYLWPALWMMPRDEAYGWWAASGEIDIMEQRGNTNQVESTLHYGGAWPNNIYSGSGPVTMGFDSTADFHTYAALWTPSSIQFLIDGNVYYQQTLQRNFWSGQGNNPYSANGQPFDQYFYIIINMAIGGNFFGGNANSLNLDMANQWANPNFLIDYVRVYQLQNAPVNANPAPAPVPQSSTIAAAVPTPTTSAAAVTAGNGGCPAGACGAASCCNDQRNGQQCYSPSQYTCAVDAFNSLYGLCSGTGSAMCKGACYNPTQYHCVNGGLQWGAEPNTVTPTPTPTSSAAVAAPSTSSTPNPTTSTTRAVTTSSTVQAAQPTQQSQATLATPSACNGGCGSGKCCNDGRNGGQCYNPSFYNCLLDTSGKTFLCAAGSGVCATNCFDATRYVCVNGGLLPK